MRTRKWLLAHCPNDDALLLAVGVGRWRCPVCPYQRWSVPIPMVDLRAQVGSGLLPE